MSSTREYLNARAFSAAQSAYDNMSPPEGGPCECAECGGSGYAPEEEDHDDPILCPHCEGHGYTDEDGNPWIQPEEEMP